jgi:hypothetical protein
MYIDIDWNFRGETYVVDSLFILKKTDRVESIFQDNSFDY